MMSRKKGQKKRWKMMARICYLLRRITHTTSIWERNERCLNKCDNLLSQSAKAILSQSETSIITKCDRYYKV